MGMVYRTALCRRQPGDGFTPIWVNPRLTWIRLVRHMLRCE